jgi:glycosyltransferase involved in cell wall biosynthesis
MRKGVAELVKALPEVFERVPDFKMCFIGKVESSPQSKMNMKDYIALKLKKYLSRIEFKQFDGAEIYLAYANTDICVFPSLWENFPNVCLEAMSAGRAVVASKFGGMSDMIVNRHSGLLLNPFDKKELAEAIVSLLNDQSLRALFGKNAREAVLTRYNKSVIGELMEKNYHLAIHGINNRFK